MSDQISLRGSVKRLLGLNPYEGFFYKAIEPSIYLFPSSISKAFFDLIESKRPEIIVEVGSYLGASAIHMARICKDLNLSTEIICIDTWQGTLDMWQKPECLEAMRLQNGHPTLYRQFLANICHSGFQDTITPLPVPSSIGLRLLKSKGIAADFVYIDGSHEYEDAKLDIDLSFEISKVLLIDDYDLDGVKKAIGDRKFYTTPEYLNQVLMVSGE